MLIARSALGRSNSTPHSSSLSSSHTFFRHNRSQQRGEPKLSSARLFASASADAPRGTGPSVSNTAGPKRILVGWTALIFIAGFSYFYVKTQNTRKKRQMMIRDAQEVARSQGASEEEIRQLQERIDRLAERHAVGTNAARGATPSLPPGQTEQSPIASLLSAFARQGSPKDDKNTA
ncbi:hypothetical protein CBOM_05322 [Ceraceosorus bombacis]|uniref:Transmembrane protein n=1 Tax=Ceraceosorus bombacis TaxID=401625 RepID=A0A0P1BNU3_9BASI|nr:hypothetical protein CBOM_05322 [Ceraceosorus bombacis]